MTTTMSCSKKGQFLSQYSFAIKKILGLDAIYALLLFFVYPMFYWKYNQGQELQMAAASEGAVGTAGVVGVAVPYYHYPYGEASLLSGFAVSALMCFMVLLVSAILYSYLHNKQSTDFYHSLPVPRKTMFLANMAAGYTAIIVPIWVNFLIALISFPIYLPNLAASEYLGFMFTQLLGWTMGSFILFSISSLVAVSVCTVVENVGYSAALLLEGSILYGMWILTCAHNFQTYSGSGLTSGFCPLYWLSPVFALGYFEVNCTFGSEAMMNQGWVQTWSSLLFWFVLGVAALFYAIKVYEKRQSERAQQWGHQGILGFIVKLMIHAVGTFILTMFFESAMNFPKPVSFIAGALIGGPLGYLVAEVITNRGFQNMKKAFPSMAAATAVMLCFSVYFAMDGFGYDQRVIKAEDVKSVELIESTGYGISHEQFDDEYARTYGDHHNTATFSKPNYVLEDRENIDRIIKLHEMAINRENMTYNGSVNLTYHKDIGTFRRYLPIPQEGTDVLLEIIYSDEFLKKYNPFFAIKPDYVREIIVCDKQGNKVKNLSSSISDRFIESIQKDLHSRTPQDICENRDNIELGSIVIKTKEPKQIYNSTGELYHYDTRLELLIAPSDTNTCALIKELGIDFTTPIKKEIDKMYIQSKEFDDDFPEYFFVGRRTWNQIREYDPFVEITDREIIEKIEESMTSRNSGRGNQYNVTVQYKNDAENYTAYSIDRATLAEILSDTEIQVPYVLTHEEEQKLFDIEGKQYEDTGIFHEVQQWSGAINTENSVSMKQYLEKYAPELLEGKTGAELNAMEHTVYLTRDGVKIIF